MSDKRVIVLGLDGLNYSLVNEGLGTGLLPHLREAMAAGVSGELLSTLPPCSAPAWTTFATGKTPGKHGVFDFWRVSYTPKRQLTPVSSRSVVGATTWQIAGQHGKRVGVVQVPLTYPPSPVNGLMMSDMLMTPNEEVDYTFPRELKAEIKSRYADFLIRPYNIFGQDEESLRRAAYWEKRLEEVNQWLFQREPFDFFVNVSQASDIVQHHFRRYLVPADGTVHNAELRSCYDPLLREVFASIDETIAHRLSLLDGNTVLFIVSDHGFGPATQFFNVNRFLVDIGLFKFRESRAQQVRRALIKTVTRTLKTLDFLHLRRRLNRDTIRSLVESVDEAVALPRDWHQTKAWSGTSSAEGIFVNLKGREATGVVSPGEEYEQVRQRILDGLRNLQDPVTGEAVLDGAYRREEIYPETPEHCPDILLEFGKHPYKVRETLSVPSWLQPMPPRSGSGRHNPMGVFIAVGADVPAGVTLQGLRLLDVAPTLLYSLGLPVPSDMEGRVLTDVFTEEYVRAHPPTYSETSGDSQGGGAGFSYTADEEAQITGQLKDLGYV